MNATYAFVIYDRGVHIARAVFDGFSKHDRAACIAEKYYVQLFAAAGHGRFLLSNIARARVLFGAHVSGYTVHACTYKLPFTTENFRTKTVDNT